MTIYLDHTATTKPSDPVVACICDLLTSLYANPASVHAAGREAFSRLQADRRIIATALGCRHQDLILTSGGTEAINLAIKGILLRPVRLVKRLIISEGEHAAVLKTAAELERQDFDVVRLPLTAQGQVSLAALEEALQQPAGLISLLHVSNETGSINPIREIVDLRNRLQPRTPIHLDAVQTWGKTPFRLSGSGVDLVSGSAHKINGPKGIGWLARREGVRLEAQLHGGGQQNGLRSGTENPVLAAALAIALQQAVQNCDMNSTEVRALRDRFLDQIAASGIPHRVFSPPDSVPHILSIAFPGLRGETMVNALSAEGVFISAGAACSSRRSKGNHVLLAMGVSEPLMRNAVRVSFAAGNSEAEIDQACQAMISAYRRLAR